MSKLSFAIAVKLIQDNFHQNAAKIKASLRAIQFQAMAMAGALTAGGFSLSGLLVKFRDTARETNRVRVALKNISGDTAGYANNMKYLVGLAKQYGQDLNTITDTYSQFAAAADAANVPLSEQRRIFTATTRAITAFGKGGREAELTFLAIQQMMSKGKISSEELRRQLGERVPFAMEAMARAAGVPIQQLDKMLKNGELLSKDILPKFATELDKMLPNVNTDNLETSLGRLKNAFINLTETLKVGDIYKSIVDGIASALGNVRSLFVALATFVTSFLAGKVTVGISKHFGIRKTLIADLEAQHKRAEAQMQLATEKRMLAELKLSEAVKASERQRLSVRLSQAKSLENSISVNKIALSQQLAAAKTASSWSLAFASIKARALAAFASIKAMVLSAFPIVAITAVASAISGIVSHFVEMKREAKEIRNIVSDARKAVEDTNSSSQIARLESIKKALNDGNTSLKEKNNLITEASRLVGVELKGNKDINKVIEDRIKLLKEQAKASSYADIIAQKEIENRSIENKYGSKEKFEELYSLSKKLEEYKKLRVGLGRHEKEWDAEAKRLSLLKQTPQWGDLRGLIGGNTRALENDVKRFEENLKVIDEFSGNLSKIVSSGATTSDVYKDSDIEDKTDKNNPLKKAEEKYIETLNSLNNQKALGLITEEEHRTALSELAINTRKEIGGLLGAKSAYNGIFKEAEAYILSSKEFREEQSNYNKEQRKLANLKSNGIITEKEYNKALHDLLKSTVNKIGSLDNLTDEEKKQLAAYKEHRDRLREAVKLKEYDPTFDYKKTEADKLRGQYDVAKQNVSLAKEAEESLETINKLIEKARTIEEALKLAEIKEDIDKLNKSLRQGTYEGIKDVANASRHIVSSLKQLRRAFSDEDVSPFERMLNIFNAIAQTVDGISSVANNLKKVSEITEKLGLAKEALAAKEAAASTQKIASIGEEAIAKKAAAASSVASSAAVAAAAQAEAASLIMAAHAYIPFAGVSIGSGFIAQMKAILASFAAIPAFAGGGIVPSGSLFGDKIVARVNSGEMILNQQQQHRLFRLANSGGITGGAPININISGKSVLRGKDIVTIYKRTVRAENR